MTTTLWSFAAFAGILLVGVIIDPSAGAFTLSVLIAATGALLVGMAAQAATDASRLGLFNPSVLLFGYLGLVYVGRPLYIMGSGELGTHQMGRYEIGFGYSGMITTSLIVLIALATFSILYSTAPTLGMSRVYCRLLRGRRTYGLRLLVLFFISFAGAAYVVLKSMQDFGDLRIALSLRADLYAGEQYLIFVLQAYKFGFLFWLADRLSAKVRSPRKLALMAVILWLPAFGFDFLTGSRADLIYRNLLPVAAILCTSAALRRPLLRYALVPVLVAVIAFVGIRVGVRDAAAAEATGTVSQSDFWDTIVSLPEFVLSGDEAAVFDAFSIILMQNTSALPPRGMEGVAAFLLAPVPSGLLDEKPVRSTTYFTEIVRPSLAASGGNIAISSLGDLYLVGGAAVAVVGYGAVGFIAGLLVRGVSVAATRIGARKQLVVLGFAAVAGLMSVIRADTTELALLPLRLGLPILVILFLALDIRPSSRRATSVSRSRWRV
ncbi:hypothetical protein AB2L57_04190 [Microbacterium sp. HA-8]|uniref:hypothetical protein n=1 Tax=Microbacterium sp. HA-8 TaxID=3234200 RepID=UPI0038F79CD5